jgi:hypothetical protein
MIKDIKNKINENIIYDLYLTIEFWWWNENNNLLSYLISPKLLFNNLTPIVNNWSYKENIFSTLDVLEKLNVITDYKRESNKFDYDWFEAPNNFESLCENYCWTYNILLSTSWEIDFKKLYNHSILKDLNKKYTGIKRIDQNHFLLNINSRNLIAISFIIILN